MSAVDSSDSGSGNPCCFKLKAKLLKLEEKRHLFRNGIQVQKQQILMLEDEISGLKKACDEERARADAERAAKEKELSYRISVESEIAALKREIPLFINEEGSQSQVMQAEFDKLKQLLEEERAKMGILEKVFEAKKQEVSEAEKEVNELRSSLQSERSKNVKVEKKLDIERQKLHKKRSSACDRKVIEERHSVDKLLKELNKEKKKASKLKQKFSSPESAIFAEPISDFDVIIKNMQAHFAEKDAEVNQLKELIEEEKMKVLVEKENTVVVKKKVDELLGALKYEKNKVVEAHKRVDSEAEKSRYSRTQLEMVRNEVIEAMSNLASEKLTKKKFEMEKQKSLNSKRCADEEKEKTAEQKRLVEEHQKIMVEERKYAANLLKELEEEKVKNEKLRKEMQELEAKLDQLQPMRLLDNHGVDQSACAQLSKMRFLEEQLKFEKKQKKHSKQVAKFEKGCNSLLVHELRRLKYDFSEMLNHLDKLDSTFSRETEVDNIHSKRARNVLSESSNPRPPSIKQSYILSHELVPTIPSPRSCLIPTAVHDVLQKCPVPFSGIKTKSDSLLGDPQREIIPCSAISSNTASFSSKQSVKSQGKDADSLATSAMMAEELSIPLPESSRWSFANHKRKHNDNFMAVAENSFGGSSVQAPRHKNRKENFVDIETIKCMQFEGQTVHHEREEKLYALDGMLTRLIDEPPKEKRYGVHDQKGDSCSLIEGAHSQRNRAYETEVMVNLHNGSDDLVSVATHKVSVASSSVFANESFDPCKDVGGDYLRFNQVIDKNVEEIAEGDVIKLLCLDNMSDEEIFHTAMERPVSPTLPEIKFQYTDGNNAKGLNCGVEDIHDSFILTDNDRGGKSCGSEANVTNTNVSQLKCKNNARENSEVYPGPQDPMATDSLEINHVPYSNTLEDNTHMYQINRLSNDCWRPKVQLSAGKEADCFCDLGAGSAEPMCAQFCVMFSDMEETRTAARIFCFTLTSAARSFLSLQTNLALQYLLISLAKERHLTRREKVCVLFSTFLQHVCEKSFSKSDDFYEKDVLDSFSANLQSVLSGVDSQTMFTRICDLSELVSLAEDFLVHKRIFCPGGVDYSELSCAASSRVEISLGGRNTIISVEASTKQFVAAAVILASICSGMNQIDYIFEFSFSVLHMSSNEPFLVLSILHVFAHLCGEKFLSTSRYSSLMTVIKTTVMLIEGASENVMHSEGGMQTSFPPCVVCPFSKSSSVDDMLSLLLGELEGGTLATEVFKDLKICASLSGLEPSNSLNEAEPKLDDDVFTSLPTGSGQTSCSLTKVTTIFPSSPFVDKSCFYNDALSLLELISSIMVWEWTCDKILPRLFKLLESFNVGGLSSSVLLLLGELARHHIEISGCNDGGVQDIKRHVSSFFCRLATLDAHPSHIAATASAFIELFGRNHDGLLLKENTKLQDGSCSNTVNEITGTCLSSLSIEQQSFLSSLQSFVGTPDWSYAPG